MKKYNGALIETDFYYCNLNSSMKLLYLVGCQGLTQPGGLDTRFSLVGPTKVLRLASLLCSLKVPVVALKVPVVEK